MTNGRRTPGADSGPRPLRTRALARGAGRARRLLAAGEWRPAPADSGAAARLLARLAASARTSATDRGRRLQRVLRTALHHLDAGAVSRPAGA